MNETHVVRVININEKVGVISWFAVFETSKMQEVCRCRYSSQAQYIANLLELDSKYNWEAQKKGGC